eukprot:COSAG01_NODE_2306_length_7946_cov_4.903148_1_plen_218_part_00
MACVVDRRRSRRCQSSGRRRRSRWRRPRRRRRRPRRRRPVSRAFPSWNRSILTEVHLCHACSITKLRMETPGQADRARWQARPTTASTICEREGGEAAGCYGGAACVVQPLQRLAQHSTCIACRGVAARAHTLDTQALCEPYYMWCLASRRVEATTEPRCKLFSTHTAFFIEAPCPVNGEHGASLRPRLNRFLLSICAAPRGKPFDRPWIHHQPSRR